MRLDAFTTDLEKEEEAAAVERKRRCERLWRSLEDDEKRVGAVKREQGRWRRRIVEKRSPEEKAIVEG